MHGMTSRTLALIAAAALAACSSGQNAQQSASSSGALRNPIDFPLYSNASIVSSHTFVQAINAGSAGDNSIFEGGNGTYTGNEVIAATQAAFPELTSWIDRVNATPPSGYTPLETGTNADQRLQSERNGLDYALFTKKQNGKTRGLLVIVMDPPLVNEHFGFILNLMSRYRSLPAIFRQPIDNTAKQRIGMTLSDAMRPDSPIGAALSALDQFEHKDTRGIVLIDAAKR